MHLNHNNNSIKKNLNWFYNRKQKVNILGSGQKPGPPFDLILIIQLLLTKIHIPKPTSIVLNYMLLYGLLIFNGK